jgi:hypothetical protein
MKRQVKLGLLAALVIVIGYVVLTIADADADRLALRVGPLSDD